jgi:hypothetical protein
VSILATETAPIPWRFNGPGGPVVLHPQCRILAVEGIDMYRPERGNIDGSPRFLGPGSRLTVRFPGKLIEDVAVLEVPEVVEEQIRSRGGW